MKLTEKERLRLDMEVLAAAAEQGNLTTCVLRNVVDWPGSHFHQRGITTADILRACRRNAKAGLMAKGRTSYQVMLAWTATDAGRAALSN